MLVTLSVSQAMDTSIQILTIVPLCPGGPGGPMAPGRPLLKTVKQNSFKERLITPSYGL